MTALTGRLHFAWSHHLCWYLEASNVEDWGKVDAGKLANWLFIWNPTIIRPIVVFDLSVAHDYQRAEFLLSLRLSCGMECGVGNGAIVI